MAADAALLNPEGHARHRDARALGAEITELCSYLYAAEYRLLVLIREFDEQNYWAEPGLCSCAHWLQFKCGIGMNAAREKVRVAHALGKLDKISRAFEQGELSYSKVRALTRIATTENEDYLLMIARHGTAHHVEKLVALARRVERLEDLEAANAHHAARALSYHYDDDGCLVLKGRLPADAGALIVKALEMALDRDFAARASDPVSPAEADSDADDVTAVTPAEPEPIEARRADALVDIAESYMNARPVPNATADRYQVVVHVTGSGPSADADDDRAHGALPQSTRITAVTSHIEDGPRVTAETSRRIACDSSILGIREDENGEVLNIGRKTRSIPPAMRRALRLRDGGCRFPGCTNSRFVDGHHIEHWADGGETRLDNLVELCRHHHRLVHEGGFACEKTESGEIVFRDRRAERLPETARLPGVPSGEDLVRLMEDRYLDTDIDETTCVTKWYAGDRMDWDMAVAALFP